MATAISLLVRELVLLAILAASGAGLAATMRSEDRPGSRTALAAGAGLVVLVGPLLFLNLFVPLEHALWFYVVPVCGVSLWLVGRKLRAGALRRPPIRELAAIAAVLAGALLIANVALVRRATLGPIAYQIADGPGYIPYIEGYETQRDDHPLLAPFALNDAAVWQAHKLDRYAWGAPWDIALRYGWGQKSQHTGSTTVAALVSGGFGWPAWTLVVPFMTVLLCAGALGTFALARALISLSPWMSAIAGALYVGPMTYQIFVDGSLGLLSGLSLIPLILICLAAVLRRPSVRTALLMGVSLGALTAVYPEQLAAVALACVAATAAAAVIAIRRRGRPSVRAVRRISGLVGLLVAAAVVITPRTAYWTYDYLANQASTYLANLPQYPRLTLRYIPGWLVQTRAFYDFMVATPTGSVEVFEALVVPLALLGVAVVGIRRLPGVRVLLAVIAAAAAAAAIAHAQYRCNYCVQRSLLLTAPVMPVLILAGFAALAGIGKRWGRDAAAAGLGAYAILVGGAMYSSIHRTVMGATVWPAYMQQVATAIAHDTPSGGIALEGFDAAPFDSWLEFQAAYNTVEEASPQRIAAIAAYDNYGGLGYYGTRPLNDPVWNPNYRWVLTRLGGLDQGRQVVMSRGPYSLQRRVYPFDVLVAQGVAVDAPDRDPEGFPWIQSPGGQVGLIQGPLTFWIAASSKGTAYLRLLLVGPPSVSVAPAPGLVQARVATGVLGVCEAVPGPASRRIVSLEVGPNTGPLGANSDPLDLRPVPVKLIRLSVATASTSPCRTAPVSSAAQISRR